MLETLNHINIYMIILKLTAENNCVSGIHSHLHHSSAAHHCPSRIADRFLTYSMNLSDWAFAQQVGTISHKITVSTHVYICMSWLCLIMMFYHSLIILSYLIFLTDGPECSRTTCAQSSGRKGLQGPQRPVI